MIDPQYRHFMHLMMELQVIQLQAAVLSMDPIKTGKDIEAITKRVELWGKAYGEYLLKYQAGIEGCTS